MQFTKSLELFNKFQKCKNKYENIELELKVLLDPRIKRTHRKFKDFIEIIKYVLKNNSNENIIFSQTINFIKNLPERKMYVKQLCFENGEQNKNKNKSYFKKSMIKPYFINSQMGNNYKLCVNKETIDEKDSVNEFDIVRFRNRISIPLTNTFKNWCLEITIVKETRNLDINNIKQLRNIYCNKNLDCDFINLIHSINSDKIEVELEYLGEKITEIEINKFDLLWEENSYKKSIMKIASIIKPNLNAFGNNLGLKQIGNNPIELDKNSYNKIIPEIDNFIITEKIDGVRTMLIIYENGYEVVNDKYNFIHFEPERIIEKSNKYIILDTEEYEINNKKFYFVFDVIWYYKNVSNLPFYKNRIELINEIVEKYDFLKSKTFISLDNNYPIQIKNFYENMKNSEYKTDGIIFITKNKNYNNTINYKWKSQENATIDFVAKKCPDGLMKSNDENNKTLYFLFSGIKADQYKSLGIQKINYYNKFFPTVSWKDSYIPIQFSPSSNPDAYLFWSDYPNLNGKIVELNYKNEWNLVKIREDRVEDLKRKMYYGNNFRIAENIWMKYSNALSIDYLCNPKLGYFKQSNNLHYKYIRKYHNYIKELLLNEKDNISSVIDLAGGKGQDLLKYINKNIKEILIIDNDENALSEIINRKHMYIKDKKELVDTNIYVKNINLINSIKKITDEIKIIKSNLIKTDLVVCNFAIHYFTYNEKRIKSFVGLINSLIKKNGIFIFTVFNGRKIFNLLENKDTWMIKNNETVYKIYKNYSGDFTGENQKIKVLLPFDSEPCDEYLINTELIIDKLKSKKIILRKSGSFDEFLSKYKTYNLNFYNKLSECDKTFTSLYNFYIFQKE